MDCFTPRTDRRRVLASLVAGVGTALLAACGSNATRATDTVQPVPMTTATAMPLSTTPGITPSLARGSGPSLTTTLTIKDGPAPLRSPNACAVDRDGNIFVGDTADSMVKKFDPAGKFLMQWGARGNGDGQFDLVAGLALDAEGNVYVADFNNTRIEVFDGSGTFLRQIATEPPVGPVGVALDAQGNSYVVNHRTHAHYLQKFDTGGNLLLAWAGNGTGPGEIAAGVRTGPEAVVVDGNGNVYVSDPDNQRVQKFDASGKHLLTFGSKGDANDQFRNGPTGLAVDSAGNIYVADHGPILKFDSAGNLIVRWLGTSGAAADNFSASRVLTVDGAGNLYIANGLNDSIQKFRQA